MKSLIDGILNRTPVSYTSRVSTPMFPWAHRNDATAQMQAFGAVGTLFSIVNRTSNATAQVDWRLYRKSVDGRRATAPSTPPKRTEVTRHACLDLWNRPNPFMTGQEFREIFQQHIDLTGESDIVIARDPRSPLPLELWPVRPDRMTPVPHPTEFLSGWIYTGPDGEQVPLGVDEVIQIKMPNPLDPYRGLGPVQALLVDLDSARYSAEWNRNFFLNSAEPGGIIEVDKRLEDDEFTELTTRWREQHQGVAQAHRVAVLEQGKWVERKFSQKEMQFAELRGVSREIIREAFGIHGHMIGISEDVNKANAEAGERSFSKWLVTPRCGRIKGMLNNKLLPLYGAQGLEFDHDQVEPPDRQADDRELVAKSQAAQLLVGVGFDPADVTATVGLPDMKYVGKPEESATGDKFADDYGAGE
jgi:HK97 family phage portal protein